MHPLTHHEILGLIGPFTRRGLHADLACSDRIARRLAFRPLLRPGSEAAPEHRETLMLESLDVAGGPAFRLTRTAGLADGPEAMLVVEGAEPSDLLAMIDSIPAGRQLRSGAGFALAFRHRLDAGGLRLTDTVAHVDGLVATMTMPPGRGNRADLSLTAALDDPVDLPEDLLAVLGWDWSRLDAWTERTRRRWTGSVRLPRWTTTTMGPHGTSGPNAPNARSLSGEAQFERAVRQIAQTLADPPRRFHERQRTARWVFAFRRTIPSIVCVALIAAAFGYSHSRLGQDSVLRMLVFNLPPLLLVAFFCLRELPRFELPRRPRPLRAATWRTAPTDRVA